MARNRLSALAAAIAAAVALFVGLTALKWYIWDIAIQQADESDRSMLFWGIPIVFIGVAALGIGSSLAVLANHSFRSRETDDPPVDL